jgi:hypothetical protein
MHLLTRARSGAILLLIAILALTAACGGGSDDETPTPTTATTASSPTVSAESASPTAAATKTSAATATRESSPTAEATETTAAVSPTTSSSTATSTSEAVASPGSLDEALGDVETIDPNLLPNYTLAFELDATGMPDASDSALSFQIEQAAVDQYHMKVSGEGQNIEIWKVGDTSYVSQGDGQVVEMPAGTDSGLFSPSLFLQSAPTFPPDMDVEKVGEDTVSGRSATHYRVSGEDLMNNADFGEGITATDVQGDLDMWIDKELNIILKYGGDITWTNQDGSDGNMKLNYSITDIGSTQEVQAPATS